MKNDDFAARVLAEARLDQPFQPFASFDRDGDCAEFIARPDSYYAQRIDDVVTVYRSDDDGEIIGTQIKGIRRLLSSHPGLRIEIREGRISIIHLLRAHIWPVAVPNDSVTVMIYRKVLELADQSKTELTLSGTL